MKTPPLASTTALFALASILCALPGYAAPVTQTTVVQTRPDAAAPIITYLKAGSELTPAPAEAGAAAPSGWVAVSLPGPFTGYVQNSDLTKALTVKPGSSVTLEPKSDSGVLCVAGSADAFEITGLRGKWTQVRLDKPLVGYVHIGSDLDDARPPEAVAKKDEAPPPVEPTTAPGKPASSAVSEEGSARGVPRFLEGRFSTAHRRFFWDPAPPYAWQISDESGSRTAYLDTTKLLLTDQLDNYIGREVIVHGTVKRMIGSDELVVAVESLRLK